MKHTLFLFVLLASVALSGCAVDGEQARLAEQAKIAQAQAQQAQYDAQAAGAKALAEQAVAQSNAQAAQAQAEAQRAQAAASVEIAKSQADAQEAAAQAQAAADQVRSQAEAMKAQAETMQTQARASALNSALFAAVVILALLMAGILGAMIIYSARKPPVIVYQLPAIRRPDELPSGERRVVVRDVTPARDPEELRRRWQVLVDEEKGR